MSSKYILKPCPFCGAEMELCNMKNPITWRHPKGDCFLAYADSEYEQIVVYEDEVETWNRRAADDKAQD